jgi:large subunit ribosomal protein L15
MKRKKNARQRGGKTHGWGAMKKHRGAGNRGGRGNAGSGKRADQRKPSYWDNRKPMRSGQKRGQDYFGKKGFYSIQATESNAINVRELDRRIDSWVSEKKIQKTGDTYTIDLNSFSIDKLLGGGQITKKVKVNVAKASQQAVEKVAAAGGLVTKGETNVATENS